VKVNEDVGISSVGKMEEDIGSSPMIIEGNKTEDVEIKKEFNVKKDVSKDDLNLIDDCIRKIKLNWKKAKEITNIDSQNPKISEKVFEYDAENEKTGGLIKLFICSDTKDIWIQGWEKKKTKKNNLIKYKLLIKCILPIEIQDCVEDLITTVLSGFKDFKKKGSYFGNSS